MKGFIVFIVNTADELYALTIVYALTLLDLCTQNILRAGFNKLNLLVALHLD